MAEERLVADTDNQVWKWAVWRSPLGEAVVGLLGDALRGGKPIRWARWRQALVAAARRSPAALLAEFVQEVRGEKEHCHTMLGFLRVGGTVYVLEEAKKYAAIAGHCGSVLQAVG